MVCPCCVPGGGGGSTEPGRCCTADYSLGFLRWFCSSKTEAECVSGGGYWHGAGTTCTSGQCLGFTTCEFCCDSWPSTINVLVDYSISDIPVQQRTQFSNWPTSGTVQSYHGSVGAKTFSQGFTLANVGQTYCGSYRFASCGPGDFNSVEITAGHYSANSQCGWFVRISPSYVSCAIGYDAQNIRVGNTLVNRCTGQQDYYFFGLVPSTQGTALAPRGCGSGSTITVNHTSVSSLGGCTSTSGSFGRVQCWQASINESSCRASIFTAGNTSPTNATINWSAAIYIP